jgi:HK97 gp10 family phage protein
MRGDEMATQSVKVEGLAELETALIELPKATARNVLKRALIDAAGPIEASAESLAPRLTGALQRSVTISTKLSRRQKALNKKLSDVEIYVGPGALVQAITQEFGTSHNRPQPFLRPAWDNNARAALDSIKDDLSQEIEKARKRLARKAERLAQAMGR